MKTQIDILPDGSLLFHDPGPGPSAIDLESMPYFRRLELAKWAMKVKEECFAKPGAEEDFQRWLAEKRAREAKKA